MRRLVLTLAAVLGAAIWLPASAHAAFGFDDFGVSFSAQDGTPETQAGSHPFAFTTSFEANTDGEDTDGRLRDLLLDLPPGLLFDPGAAPRCLEADFETIDEGFNACSGSAAVGIVSGAVGEAGDWSIAPVFSLVPHVGELMRFGFRVGGTENVVVSAKPNRERPHEMTFEIEDFPEAVELFGLELHLWGVPADAAHDSLRGRCAGPDGSLGECPVAIQQRPLLTLPTRCDGPLAAFYEADPWIGETDSGGAVTEDGAENPQGPTGCGKLNFAPEAVVAPMTEDAKSPTGIEFSLAFFDEGLTNPAGLAQSQLRDLVLVLPEGTEVDPSAAGGLGICTEAELGEEAPEDLPGTGCPGSSAIGSLELESPLLAGEVLDGDLYLATPLSELAKNGPLELYAVARNAARGIVVKQVVEIEPDAGSGQLVAYAEDLPQLPFSRLDLELFAADSPLLTPPRCGDYEIEAELSPWAGNGDYRFVSEFSLDTGPGGGPCPSDRATPPADPVPPPIVAPPAIAAPPPIVRRPAARCPRGKRLVRRNGARRCVRRCRKSKRAARRKNKRRCVSTKRKKHRKHHRR